MALLVAMAALGGACGGSGDTPRASDTTGTIGSPVAEPDGADDVASLSAVAVDGDLQFLSEDGVTLAGRVFGSGEIGVVLVHRTGGSLSRWDGLAPALAQRNHRVLAFDLRGHGRSDGEKGVDPTLDVLAAVSYLRDESLTRIVIVGVDDTAVAALDAAGQSSAVVGVVSLTTDDDALGPLTETALSNLEQLSIPTLWLAATVPAEGSGREILVDRLDNDVSVQLADNLQNGDLLAGPAGSEVFGEISTFVDRFG